MHMPPFCLIKVNVRQHNLVVKQNLYYIYIYIFKNICLLYMSITLISQLIGNLMTQSQGTYDYMYESYYSESIFSNQHLNQYLI